VSIFGGDGHLLRMTKRRKGQLLVGLHIPRTPKKLGVTRKAEPRPSLSDDQLGPALRPTASSVAGGYIIEKDRERKRHSDLALKSALFHYVKWLAFILPESD
jgi:hypothetical protein